MKAKKGTKCVICNKPADIESFDGTGFCKRHAKSWLEFSLKPDINLNDLFVIWKAKTR